MDMQPKNKPEKWTCAGCGRHESVFWYRHALGCDSEGNNGTPFALCDDCQYKFMLWLKVRQ